MSERRKKTLLSEATTHSFFLSILGSDSSIAFHWSNCTLVRLHLLNAEGQLVKLDLENGDFQRGLTIVSLCASFLINATAILRGELHETRSIFHPDNHIFVSKDLLYFSVNFQSYFSETKNSTCSFRLHDNVNLSSVYTTT